MPGEYIGHVDQNDPLYNYMKQEIFPQLGCDCREGIRVFRTNGSNEVYVYEDRASGRKVVGKFFYSSRMKNWDLAWKRLDREYRNLNEFRQYVDQECHYVAKVLGRNDELNRLLVVEYVFGEPLDSVILRSIHNNDDALLFDKLKALAYFLATVHNRSAQQGVMADFESVCAYFRTLVQAVEPITSPEERIHLEEHCNIWHSDPVMWQDQSVLVHGDATPANFFFGDGMHVISFDMERVRRSDRLFDVGRICCELQHFFCRNTGNKYKAEPFIGHFLWEYCTHFPDRESAFRAITGRIPFYMGMNLIRIARNDYLEYSYRRMLLQEAHNCLEKKK